MSNTHLVPDIASELQSICRDFLPACILSATWPTVPVSSLTIAAFATHGYVRDGANLIYVNQAAAAIILSGSDGLYWLALHRNTSTAVSLWTRQPGTHYLWRSSASTPPEPAGGLLFASVTVLGGIITAVFHGSVPGDTGILAQQSANAVAITGGTMEDVAVTGGSGTALTGLQVQGPMGIGMATDGLFSLKVAFQARFNDRLGIGMDPTYALDVAGQQRMSGPFGIGIAPSGSWSLLLGLDLAAKPGGGSWANSTSFAHLKQNIRPITDALTTLLALRGRHWEWLDAQLEAQMPGTQAGFVIEEIAEDKPDWACLNANGEVIAYQERGATAYMVEALRELVARLETMEARIAALEAAQP